MNPLLDQLLVIAAILAAVGFFIWHNFRQPRKGGSGCSGGCNCGQKKTSPPPGK